MSITLFGATSPGTSVSCLSTLRDRRDQVLVKDEVLFKQELNPYKALTAASQRVSDGKSIFFPDDERAQAPGRLNK